MSDTIPTEDSLITFDSRDQAAELTLELIEMAHQEVCFFGPIIDPVLLDNDRVIDKLSEFARRSPRTQIRVVVQDTRKNVVNSHRLLPLAQKLTSSIKIHIASQKHQELLQQFLIIDTKAYLFCPDAERYQGRVEKHAPAVVRDFLQQFEEIWSHSRPDINSRRLHL